MNKFETTYCLDITKDDLKNIKSKDKLHYEPHYKVWYWYGDINDMPKELENFRPEFYSWESYAQNKIRNTPPKAVEKPPAPSKIEDTLKGLIKLPGIIIKTDPSTNYQTEIWNGLRQILPENQTIIITTHESLLRKWAHTINECGHPAWHIIVIPYQKTYKLFLETKPEFKETTTHGLARRGEKLPADIHIWDQSHWLKNSNSTFAKFAQNSYKDLSKHIWISNNIGQKPYETTYLLPILNQPPKTTGTTPDHILETILNNNNIKVKKNEKGFWHWQPNPEDIEKTEELLQNPINHTKPFVEIPNILKSTIEKTAYLIPKTELQKQKKAICNMRADTTNPNSILKFQETTSTLKAPQTISHAINLTTQNIPVIIHTMWDFSTKHLILELEKTFFKFEIINEQNKNSGFQKLINKNTQILIAQNIQNWENVPAHNETIHQILHNLPWQPIWLKNITQINNTKTVTYIPYLRNNPESPVINIITKLYNEPNPKKPYNLCRSKYLPKKPKKNEPA